jgi:hypothetical protein
MSVVVQFPIKPRCADAPVEIALTIFTSLRPGLDAPSALLKAHPELTPSAAREAFALAHRILIQFEQEATENMMRGGGQSV